MSTCTAFSMPNVAVLTGVAFYEARTSIEICLRAQLYLMFVCANTVRLGLELDYTYH